jgi:hypothetical protein
MKAIETLNTNREKKGEQEEKGKGCRKRGEDRKSI